MKRVIMLVAVVEECDELPDAARDVVETVRYAKEKGTLLARDAGNGDGELIEQCMESLFASLAKVL